MSAPVKPCSPCRIRAHNGAEDSASGRRQIIQIWEDRCAGRSAFDLHERIRGPHGETKYLSVIAHDQPSAVVGLPLSFPLDGISDGSAPAHGPPDPHASARHARPRSRCGQSERCPRHAMTVRLPPNRQHHARQHNRHYRRNHRYQHRMRPHEYAPHPRQNPVRQRQHRTRARTARWRWRRGRLRYHDGIAVHGHTHPSGRAAPWRHRTMLVLYLGSR